MEFHQTLQTHSSSRRILIMKTLELGANTIGVVSLCNSEWLLNRQFPVYLKESLMEFHQTLQTHSYLQDEYF